MRPRLAISVCFGLLLSGAVSARAGIINVPAGGDLQAALNQAQPGDTIVLAAGATYTGNFVLPAKSGTGVITIRSNAPDSSLPAPGQRITPSYAGYLPKLQAPAGAGGMPPLSTAPYAAYYVIEFIEFLPNPSGTGSLLALGSAESSQNTLAVVPHDIIVDRCYLHSYSGVAQLRGIALNSASTTIENSYISEIKAAGSDSQAIAGWNGPGPFTIINNYLEAAGENFLIGGSSMFIPNVTPTNIEFRHNYVTKQLAWRGSGWTVKNLLELKHAQDVVIDGNVFENNWVAAQPGYSILFTPRNQYGDNLWTIVQRVSFTNNIVRHVSSAVNILGWDNEHPSQQTNHITIRNNVLEDVSAANWGGDGRLLQISETPYVTVDHNTGFNSGSAVYAYNTASNNFVFTNNVVNASYYGISGASTGGNANTAISMYFPGGTFLDNLLVACPDSYNYPSGNYFPAGYPAVGFVDLSGGDYHLSSGSAYKNVGTDGQDPGADIDALNAAISGGTPDPPPPPPDAAPVVSMTSPAAGASYVAPATIQCAASATDGDSTPVARVDFYANDALIGSATGSPYIWTWTNVAAGSYSLTAVAIDTAGLQTRSSAVAITVTAPVTPPPDLAPTVSITAPAPGSAYTAPATIGITASASDGDTTPVARVDFYANGTLVGSSTTAPFATTWSGVAAGSYSLTAVATDTAGLRTTSAPVAITVTAGSSGGGTSGGPLPTGWTDLDVGNVGQQGGASYAGGVFTVTGAGADIWGTTDAFNFASQPLSGDGQVVARVLSMQNTNRYAKAGVMLRESLSPSSSHMLLDVTPGGMELLVRQGSGASTTVVASAAATTAVWVKIIRSGNTVAAYSSPDAVRWTLLGAIHLNMATTIYAGLAVCSHDTSQTNTATFDNASVSTTKAKPRKTVSYVAVSRRKTLTPSSR